MSNFEKPIYISMATSTHGNMLVAPIKPGTRIRVRVDNLSYSFLLKNTETTITGTLEYRDWLGVKENYSLYAGIRYGPHEDDWQVILDDTVWELI